MTSHTVLIIKCDICGADEKYKSTPEQWFEYVRYDGNDIERGRTHVCPECVNSIYAHRKSLTVEVAK